MPPRWLRLSNPLIYFPGSIFVFSFLLNTFPDPPAVQEAQSRRWAQAKRQREEANQRAMEARIERYEQENPGVFDRPRWDNKDDDTDPPQDRN